MRGRVFLTVLSLALMLFFSGCGNLTADPAVRGDDRQAGEQTREQTGIEEQNGQLPETQQQAGQSQIGQEKQPEVSGSEPKTERPLPGTDKITVVAKSGGEISANEEKEAILDEIAKALDEILNSANSLEQVEDTDLDK